jgi:Lhr-like helicase
MEEEMSYLERLSSVIREYPYLHLLKRDFVDKMKMSDKKYYTIETVRKILNMEKMVKNDISEIIDSEEFGKIARDNFAKIIRGKSIEVVTVGKFGPLKVKWRKLNTKKGHKELEKVDQKVFQDAGNTNLNGSFDGSIQNETQFTEGKY